MTLITATLLSRTLVLLLVLATLGGCTRLGALNAVLPKDDRTHQTFSDIAYGEHPRQQLDVYQPVSASDESLPVVLFIYGGSWQDGRRQDYEFVGRALNAAGYVAVLPDYRLVPEVRYPAFVLDGGLALQWVYDNISRYGGDPQKIFVAGHSAGAYNASMLVMAETLFRENDIKIPRVLGFAGLAGPYDFIPFRSEATKAAFKGVKNLPRTQPVNLIDAGTPPLLLIHGKEDELVWVKHSRSLHRAANGAGAESTLNEYEDVGHIKLLLSLSKPFRHTAPTFQQVVDFFDGILARQEN